MNDRLFDTLRLMLVSGVGPKIRKSLLERFDTPAAVFAASEEELLSVPGVGNKLAREIRHSDLTTNPAEELELCEANNITLLPDYDERYPRCLREIHNPPPLLFERGELLPRDSLGIAIVGTRHASDYGQKQARLLAAGLARAGLTIVSGMARGIDGVAHRAALEAGGRTVAVLGSGLMEIYPPEHKNLLEEIAAQGAVLSEFPPRMKPSAGAFPQRNRIISGLSLGTIVIEAAQRSGALITARLAMEQNREVFAVPGRIDQPNSKGCHLLIRDGATLVESVDDVLDQLGPLIESVPCDVPAQVPKEVAGTIEESSVDATPSENSTIRHPAELMLNDVERKVLDLIGTDPTRIDTVIANSGLAAHNVLATVSALEMRHLIRRLSGTTVARR
ncbi:MAG: DNA-processing protein DprA [Planctomycetia bacterium]|jgi:DNA processing protein